MGKPGAWQTDPATYPHGTAVQTRFQDLDPLGHINNVAMAALFETARVRFNHALGLMGFRGHRWLVAQVRIDYLAEGHHPEDIEIRSAIGDIGNRSWHILAAAFQGGRAIATSDVILVMERQSGASSLPAEFREALERCRVRLPA